MKFEKTNRGFLIAGFDDYNAHKCVLQESSLATQPMIWLGMEGATMHLTQKMVADMLPHLQKFVETGNLVAPLEEADTLIVTETDRFHVKGIGMVVYVKAPFDMDRNHPQIVGREVSLAGPEPHTSFRVKAVERFLPAGPIREGDDIGLLVDRKEELE